MANVLRFDPATGLVIDYLRSVNTPDYEGQPGVLINPVLPAGVSIYDLRVVAGAITQLTLAERQARDAAVMAGSLAALKATAKDYVNSRPDDIGLVIRAVVKVTLAEINQLRAAASLPPRTAAQMRSAIEAELDL